MGKKRQTKGRLKKKVPITSNSSKLLSSKATNNIVNQRHILLKEYARAKKQGNQVRMQELSAELNGKLSIENYQRASSLGQSARRGGDSSKVLVDWLEELFPKVEDTGRSLLEIGSLSCKNAVSKSRVFSHRVFTDLNPTEKGIIKEDFMERKLPESSSEKFDCVSLSLVLNYVPDAQLRGDMLKRIPKFLSSSPLNDQDISHVSPFPCLFLVLPSACVNNSRYFNHERLEKIMKSLGFKCIKSKETQKMDYWLFKLISDGKSERERVNFKKEVIRTGASRNNFAILLTKE